MSWLHPTGRPEDECCYQHEFCKEGSNQLTHVLIYLSSSKELSQAVTDHYQDPVAGPGLRDGGAKICVVDNAAISTLHCKLIVEAASQGGYSVI